MSLIDDPNFWLGFLALEVGLPLLIPSKRWAGGLMVVAGLLFLGWAFGVGKNIGASSAYIQSRLSLFIALSGTAVFMIGVVAVIGRFSRRKRKIPVKESSQGRGSSSLTLLSKDKFATPITEAATQKVEARSETLSSKLAEEGTLIDVTPERIMSFFMGNTAIQGQKLVAVFIGKQMQLSGRLREVLSNYRPDRAQVTFDPIRDVFMHFQGQKVVERLSMLRPGDLITVRGQIREVTSGWGIQLDNCELIDSNEGNGSKS